MKTGTIYYFLLCIVTSLLILVVAAIAEDITIVGVNNSQQIDYYVPVHEQNGHIIFLEGMNGTGENRSGPYIEQRVPNWMERRENPPPDDGFLLVDWQFPVISIAVSLIILVIMIIAGFATGKQYQFNFSKRAGFLLTGCHLVSALLIGGFTITLYLFRSSEDYYYPFLNSMFAIFGILAYLALSSLIQAISIKKLRPLIPLHQGHILFAVIALILLLSVRTPAIFSLPMTILAALIVIIPGAAFSLITTHFIQKIETRNSDYQLNKTITRSLPLIQQELPPSFPEKLTSKYHDISVIGSGGMAIVYRAVRNDNERVVALKIPFSADETSGKTFLNEMSVWRDLPHEHIAQITDQNIFPVPYVELEYIPRSLKDITLPVPPAHAIKCIRQIGQALQYAHEKGVIHRDIKPGNVLFSEEGEAKLTDWGLSKFIERGEDTRNTSFSLFYASPEQLAPEKYGNGDQRTDIYQLGILLYELLCGCPPYGTQNIGELFTRIQKNEYILPSDLKLSLAPFDQIITLSLKADPAERFQTMTEFLKTLEIIENTLDDSTYKPEK